MLIGIEMRLLNGHGSEMEMLWITRKDHRKWKWNWKCNGKLRRDEIGTRDGKIAVKDQNGKTVK